MILQLISPQWGLSLRTWVPRPNFLKIILPCFVKCGVFIPRCISCRFGISSIGWHSQPSSEWLRFFFLSCPGFWAWYGPNGERIRTSCGPGLAWEPHVTRQKIGVQITVTLYFIKGKDSQRQLAGVCFFLIITPLRYNSHTIKSTLLKCTIYSF